MPPPEVTQVRRELMKQGTQDGCMHPSVALHTEEKVPCTEGAPMCALKAKVARICRRQRAL